MKKIKILVLLGFVGVSSAIFYSCQKTDKVSTKEDAGIEQIRQRFKNEPLRQIQVLNIPVTGYYGDINGNRLEVISKSGNEKVLGTS